MKQFNEVLCRRIVPWSLGVSVAMLAIPGYYAVQHYLDDSRASRPWFFSLPPDRHVDLEFVRFGALEFALPCSWNEVALSDGDASMGRRFRIESRVADDRETSGPVPLALVSIHEDLTRTVIVPEVDAAAFAVGRCRVYPISDISKASSRAEQEEYRAEDREMLCAIVYIIEISNGRRYRLHATGAASQMIGVARPLGRSVCSVREIPS